MTEGWRISSNGCIYRKKCVTYPNGSIYDGEFNIRGKWDGEGSLTSENWKYIGSFENGLFHGRGILYYSSSDHQRTPRYEGFFLNGKRNGIGVYFDGQGGVWDGSWRENQFTGQGEVQSISGDKYSGEWEKGKLNCTTAVVIFANGDRYEGSFRCGRMHGDIGRYYFRHGLGSYIGQYKVGLKHGKGVRVFMDQSTYTGDFFEDEISGEGIMKFCIDHKEFKMYEGQWDSGAPHGYGTLTYREEHHLVSYSGYFSNGRFHGCGKLLYRDGGYYEGDFVSGSRNDREKRSMSFSIPTGKRHGLGIRVWSTGVSFEGAWLHDDMSQGIYTDPKTCSKYVGGFQNGQKSGYGREIWILGESNRAQFDPRISWLIGSDGLFLYEGTYSKGIFEGNGTFLAPDGKAYDGEWEKGRPSGYGVAIFLPRESRGDSTKEHSKKCGTIYRPAKYSGRWKDGMRHGHGTLYFFDGTQKTGKFTNGSMEKIDTQHLAWLPDKSSN